MLWASSRLAPSYSTRPCDLPVQKTRDASNRRLPPKRLACTRISCVPGFRSRLSPRGHPTESKALRGITGGPNGSRHSDRFGGLSLTQHRRCSHSSVCLVRSASRLSGHERGRFLPTARGAIEPLTSLVATSRSLRRARHLRACLFVRRPVGRAYEVAEWGSCQARLPHRSVTTDAFDKPGCLPSVRTLRRIRWPLQPRSRDPRATFQPDHEDRSMTLSRHRGSRPIRSRFCPVRPTYRCPFARCIRRRFHPPTLTPS